MAREWLYKATDTIAPLNATRDLAIVEGFLAKAAYENGDRRARADYVKAVTVGDLIHFYFKNLSDPRHVAHTIGTFEVTDNTLSPSRYSWPTEQTHLVTVTDQLFASRLKALGYDEDPQLGGITGWALRWVDQVTPPYDADLFPGPHCFVPRP